MTVIIGHVQVVLVFAEPRAVATGFVRLEIAPRLFTRYQQKLGD